jgi:hypothetical protein
MTIVFSCVAVCDANLCLPVLVSSVMRLARAPNGKMAENMISSRHTCFFYIFIFKFQLYQSADLNAHIP